MTKLESFIRKHFNLDSECETHLPTILSTLQTNIDDGHYDDDFGRVSEYTLYDAFDEELTNLLDSHNA